MSEFAIPASLLAELPADPADLLAVAMRLAQFSFKEQSTQAEAEVSQLRTILLSRQTELRSTGRRCDELEAELAHARAETRRALAEVERLNAEKTTLVESVWPVNVLCISAEPHRNRVAVGMPLTSVAVALLPDKVEAAQRPGVMGAGVGAAVGAGVGLAVGWPPST